MLFQAFVRIFKVVALLGFALPWFAVSCSGQKLIEARGYELVIGAELKPQGMAAAAQAQAEQAKALGAETSGAPGADGMTTEWAPKELQYLAAGAAALLVLGLIVGFFVKAPGFHIVSAALAAIAGGLSYAVFALADTAFKAEIAKSAPAPNPAAGLSDDPSGAQFEQMGAAMAQGMFQFTAEPGLWLTVGGCVAVVLTAIIGLSIGARAVDTAAAPPPPAA